MGGVSICWLLLIVFLVVVAAAVIAALGLLYSIFNPEGRLWPRFERGFVYVRGYKSDDRQTPFREGYLITWIDQDIPREKAIVDAVRRTETALSGRASSNPIMEGVHRIRDMILEHSQLRKLVAASYIENKLNASRHSVKLPH